MKRVALFVLMSMFAGTLAFADNASRMSELQAEQQKLIEQYNVLNAESQKIQIRLLEIQGAMKELSPGSKMADMNKDMKK